MSAAYLSPLIAGGGHITLSLVLSTPVPPLVSYLAREGRYGSGSVSRGGGDKRGGGKERIAVLDAALNALLSLYKAVEERNSNGV